MDRIVIKVGSLLLTQDNGHIDAHNIQNIAFQIADAIERYKVQVILVSSGAIACGSEFLNFVAQSTPEKQAAAAVGQPLLIHQYHLFFQEKGHQIAQLLLTKDGFHQAERRQHAHNTLSTLLQKNVVPIINENDSVAVDEIHFGDNDELASEVAVLIQAQKLILLSNVKGVYTDNPILEHATLISTITDITEDYISQFDGTPDSKSRGGIRSKLQAARYASEHGIDTFIANGREPHIISRILSGTAQCTHISAKGI